MRILNKLTISDLCKIDSIKDVSLDDDCKVKCIEVTFKNAVLQIKTSQFGELEIYGIISEVE